MIAIFGSRSPLGMYLFQLDRCWLPLTKGEAMYFLAYAPRAQHLPIPRRLFDGPQPEAIPVPYNLVAESELVTQFSPSTVYSFSSVSSGSRALSVYSF